MLDHIDHVGIAVEDVEAAAPAYTALGLRVTCDETVPSQGTRVLFLSAPSGPDIELLAPLEDESPVGKFLAKRGPGMHHVCYAVPDLGAAIAYCQANGYEMIDGTPRTGAKGKLLAFIHPRAMGGVLVELVELKS
jgi:methylmalonyl-CoA epimerase